MDISKDVKMGFPTANLDVSDSSAFPSPGVYAVKVHIDGEKMNAEME